MYFKFIVMNKLLVLLPLLIFAGIIGTSGCNDSGVINPPPPYDSNVVIYKGVSAFYCFLGTNDTSHMGINLWEGKNTRQISTIKDMELIDSANTQRNIYFRSGDFSQILIGLKTRFNRIYSNMTDSTFDTLSVIPDSNNLLDPLDFTSDDTYGNGAWGYFNFNQAEKPVYSFYLAGKFANGTTAGYRVYGVFHISQILEIPSPHGILITIDIKLNIHSYNHFVH